MEEQYKALPYESQQRLPITASIPYFFRWKIYNAKLLLNDLQYLVEKHEIPEAMELYNVVRGEISNLCFKLAVLIRETIERGEKFE